ncbi:hypothetical protein LCGC14_0262640 [marine sediment metagenome]|uniref:Uncharacterized protein n=1 Tax=marine sediment metagenome TaxID=412755 RepID=A0A0F9U179_9ZZZZ
MAEFMSPQQLYDNPKRWLNVPHVMHESLLKFQEWMFPGFSQKLVDGNIHCLECEGEKPFEVITLDTFEEKLCTGYIGVPGNVELLRLTDVIR